MIMITSAANAAIPTTPLWPPRGETVVPMVGVVFDKGPLGFVNAGFILGAGVDSSSDSSSGFGFIFGSGFGGDTVFSLTHIL